VARGDADRCGRAWSETEGLANLALPLPFDVFVSSPEAGARVRSATGCYIEPPNVVVPVEGGGHLVHSLSDQQWIRHWLLYIADGAEAVVSTYPPYGFIEERDPGGYDPGDLHPLRPNDRRGDRLRRVLLGIPVSVMDRERDLLPPAGTRRAHTRARPLRGALSTRLTLARLTGPSRRSSFRSTRALAVGGTSLADDTTLL
jgi:hypothetical protein